VTTNQTSMVKYNAAVRAARTAAKQANNAIWIIGDAALSVATEYGQNKLAQFADDIAVKSTTVANYQTTAKKFPAAEIARDLQWATVYEVFRSQDDAFTLITAGNDGAKWTVSAARKLVQDRNAPVPVVPEGDESEGNGGEVTEPADELTVAEAEMDRLYGELVKQIAKVNKIRAARKLAKVEKPAAPAAPATMHAPAGMPAHKPEECSPACPSYVKPAGVVAELPTPRRSRARNAA
jgi:hypothetical protein